MFVFFPLLPATGQMETMHGTTIVMFLSQNEITVAADSRIRYSNIYHHFPLTLYFDDQCKISALSDKVLVAVSGVLRYCAVLGWNCEWDALDIAKDVFREIQVGSTNDIPQRLATAWGAKMSDRLRLRYFNRPEFAAADAPHGVPLSVALFANADEGGILHAAYVQITYDLPFLFGPIHTALDSKTIAIPSDGRWMQAFTGTGGDIVDELWSGLTPLDRAERAGWPQSVMNDTGTTKEMEDMASYLVEMSIFYYPILRPAERGKIIGIGGPIDSARITGSGVSWIRHKDHCQ